MESVAADPFSLRRPGSLPLELTSFVGRNREVAEVGRLLAGRRLLTLTGPGGSGKTRLALAVAQDLVEEYGAWWVELAPISDPKLVVRAVASAFGVSEAPDLSPAEALVEHLRGWKTLLVLDNCEHVIEECADLADTLLRACPGLRILATSREPLRVAGEYSWQVPSLSMPDTGISSAPEELAGYEAVHLFVERAQAVDAGFGLTEANASVVARLCQKLDGIPLAIELAAARSRVLTADQILERLEDPLELLTSGDRSAVPRQRTLRATLHWSYDLLSEDERALFRRLSVSVGGWDLEAAEAAGAGEPVEAGLVLDLLSALVDKSLVVAETETGGALRYGMLEPVRQFGREKLGESGEAPDVRRRHAEHYLALAETASPELLGPDQGQWLRRLRTEFANLREAQAWSLEPGEEAERARLRLRLPAALWRFWTGQRFEEGKVWLQTALERDPGGFPAVRARALDGLGYILLFQQEYERAMSSLEEAVALYKDLDDRSGTAFALANLGYAMLHGGYMERVPVFVGGAEALMAGDLDDHARAYLRQVLATAAILEGDLDSAVAQFEEALALCRQLGDLRNTSMALFNLGMIKFAQGDLPRGAASLQEGARISRDLGDRVGGLYYVWAFGMLSARRGSAVQAARLWGAAEALRERMGMSLSYLDRTASGYEHQLEDVRSALEEATFDAAWAEGRAMSPEGATEYALEVMVTSFEETQASRTPPAVPTGKPPAEGGGKDFKNNLPVARSGFVGREREMSEVGRALASARLLTLTGAGGCGKTRLALEVARDLADAGAHPDGVWIVDLASLSEGDLVPGAVAAALGLRGHPELPVADALVDFLRSKRMLLILDNCEHLIGACASLVDALLGSCENLRVMATSREALGVAGEVNWMVPSLTVPEAGKLSDPQSLMRYEAIELFVERARSRIGTFELTRENAAAVADICRKLDGMPLAIELATARMGALSVGQISERLGNSIELLKTSERTAAPRQRTLKAALAWSYDLLSEEERELFGRLSVFAGGWTLEAAEAVGTGEPVEAGRVLDLLSALVDKSLVVAGASGEGGLRYRMLEPVRHYALENLVEGGDAGETRRRHAAYFVALAEKARPELRAGPQVGWLERLEKENGNLRGALSWALSADDFPTAARLSWGLWTFWWIRNHQIEGRRWMEQILLARDELPTPLRIRATIAAEAMAYGQGDAEAVLRYAAELMELSRAVGGDALAESFAHAGTGLVATVGGDFDVATRHLQEGLPLFREAGESGLATQTHTWLGTVLLLQGDLAGARRRFEEGLSLGLNIGDRLSICNALFNLAQLALAWGDYTAAFQRFAEGLAPSEELGDRGNVAYILEGLGIVAGARGDARRAARLLGASEAMISSIGLRGHTYYRPDRALYERIEAGARSTLDDVSFEAAREEGRAMSPEQAVEYALEEPAPSPQEAPAAGSSDGIAASGHNLPAARSGFVGREREMSEVGRALSMTRLLTITGAGGCGKTRLALEVARDFVEASPDEYPDGVWLVELASLEDGTLVPGAVAAALGVRERPDLPVTEELTDFLRTRRLLLVLDNCEHLTDACASLVDTLLDSCENLRVMATSREILGVAGETNWTTPSLTVPDAVHPPDPRSLTRYEAVQLFVERARARVPAFVLTPENAAAVADICRKLDGIPLAIELATARMGALSVGQISERLGDALGFLTTGDRTRAPRQRTLRATLAWGYELLREEEQKLFGRLSVFAGGWDLETAEAVGAGGGIEGNEVLDLLSSLVDKSLVLVEVSDGGAPRYRLLETVRQYASEKLAARGEVEAVRRRHALFFLEMAERSEPELSGAEQVAWLDRLDGELDNLRAAVGWFRESGQGSADLRLAGALWRYCYLRGHYEQGRGWLEGALADGDDAPSTARAKAYLGAGALTFLQCEYDRARDLLQEALALYRVLEDDGGIASASQMLGSIARERGEYARAEALHEESLALFRKLGDEVGEAQSLNYLAYAAWLQGKYQRANELCEETLLRFRGLRDNEVIVWALISQGASALYSGDLHRARTLLERSRALSNEVGYREGVAWSLNQLGVLAYREGDYPWATNLLRESLEIHQFLGDRWRIGSVLEALAEVQFAQRRLGSAACLFGAARAVREAISVPVPLCERDDYERGISGARAQLGEAAFEAAFSEGRAMSPLQAVEYAPIQPTTPHREVPVETPSTAQPRPETLQEESGPRRNNLPVARSVLVGREREMEEVGRALASTRLLTLTGAGGSGKTRLALEVARDLADADPGEYPDGVWLVELASLAEGALVPGAVAAALGVREKPDLSVTDSLVDFLRSRRMLLVLDNCEHLIEDCASLVDTLVDSCENLRVMATSREALGVPGEVNWVVPSLTVPDAAHPPDPRSLTRYEAVQLFVERARARVPAFVLTPENAAAVADICRKLDGIPLAIELATARMGALSVGQISERLGDALGFLTTGDRTRAPRQRTLRATLAWGYELLREEEQKLFGRLSVFAGGWDLETAEAVGAAGGIRAGGVLDLLGRLVDQSLVVAETGMADDVRRYRMLEPIRQYALELLEHSGEAREVRDRHAALFAALAEKAHTELRGPAQVGWIRRFMRENDNLRAALAWALSSGDFETAALLGWALWPFWFYRGYQREGRHLMESVLERGSELSSGQRIRATVAVAVMAYGQGDNEAVVDYMTDLLELSRQVGGDAYAEGYARAGLGLVAMNRGDLVKAAARLEEALPQFIECGELWTAAQTHTWLGTVLLLQGDQERAVARFEEGLALARWIGDRAAIYNALYTLAQVALVRNEYEAATSNFIEGMGLSEEMGDLANVAYCLEGLATVAGARGEAARSARLFGAAQGLLETIGVPVWTYYTPDRSLYERTMADMREALGEAAFAATFSEGSAMSPERTIEYALDEAEPEPPAPVSEPAQPVAAAPARAEDQEVRLRIFALGPARVEKEGLTVDSPDWIQKSRELLYYLLSHPEGRTKEQIGLALWPEASTAQLRSSFHDTVFRLRRALGGKEWVVFGKRRYAFGRSLDYSYDVEAFEENVSEARRLRAEAADQAIRHLQEAAGLYRGDFLEDIAQSEWTLERQDELRRTYGESLLLLGGLLLSRNRNAEAADAYRQAISHDRFLEEAHRGLMRSHAALGEPGRALRHYEELVGLLEDELGSSPAPETVALYEGLRAGEEAF